MSLALGTRLGNYEVLSTLGSGGMGEVYKARDLKLGRFAAIKVLKQELASDSERLPRFEQEARAASALNHPNIVTIYEIGDREGTPYIAMELVNGISLREMLAGGPLPNDKLFRYATQMAEGLAKAHQAGIVHRDLKPENILISDDGYIKIVDFGLAKLLPERDVGAELSTLAKETTPGAILGTVGYMSPEQAKGESVDFRSDQFSLGTILYEMATGARAFERDSSVQTLAAIIEDDPHPVTLLNPSVPAQLASVIDRCLSKEVGGRFESTRDLAKQIHSETLGIPGQPSGRHSLAEASVRGLLAIILVVIVGFFVTDIREWVLGKADVPRIESIAVLPLENLSGDPEQQYFADGMTDALITDLGSIGALRVISRTSVMQYRDSEKSLPTIAEELNVDAVVEGSVLRAGDRVRISATLIDASGDTQLWTQSYERDVIDLLALQREIARATAEAIQGKLSGVDPLPSGSVAVVVPEAHDLYLRGRYVSDQFTRGGLERAIELFREATEIDPNYAGGYAGLAKAYSMLGTAGYLDSMVAFPTAKAAALKAVDIDPSFADTYMWLGWILTFHEWNWSEGENAFQRSLELNPNSGDAHLYYALHLAALGRTGEAIREAQRGRELDPLSAAIGADVGWMFYFAGEYARAVEEHETARALHPNHWDAYHHLGRAYVQAGQYDDAIVALKKGVALEAPGGGYSTMAALGHAYGVAGRRADAIALLEQMAEDSEIRHVQPYLLATVHAGLGNDDQAIEWLEKAYDARDWYLPFLNVEPGFDGLRSDARFQDLCRRLNFPE